MNVPELGEILKCEDLTVFRVDHRVIPLGSRLRRYHLRQHEQRIDEMQPMIDAGVGSLRQYLSGPEWQRLELDNKTVGLASDVMKMLVVLEAIFEHARARFAPKLPSRLDCAFVWPTLQLARDFRGEYNPEGVIHRCRVSQGEAVLLDGGLLPPGISLSDLSPEAFSGEFQATQSRAERYWAAKGPPTLSELLVVGEVEVVGVESAP